MDNMDGQYGTGLHPRTGKENPLHFEYSSKGTDQRAADAIKERLARQKELRLRNGKAEAFYPISAGWSFLIMFVLLLLWIAFAVFMGTGVEAFPFKILNILFFGMGGAGRGILGTLGGCIGKAVYISALCTLAGGGMPYLRAGCSKIYVNEYFEEKNGIILYVFGIAGGLLLYWFFTGGEVYGFMAGLAGAMVCLRSLGGLKGILVSGDTLSAGLCAGFLLSIPLSAVFSFFHGISLGPGKISFLSAVFTGLGSVLAALFGVIFTIVLSEEKEEIYEESAAEDIIEEKDTAAAEDFTEEKTAVAEGFTEKKDTAVAEDIIEEKDTEAAEDFTEEKTAVAEDIAEEKSTEAEPDDREKGDLTEELTDDD